MSNQTDMNKSLLKPIEKFQEPIHLPSLRHLKLLNMRHQKGNPEKFTKIDLIQKKIGSKLGILPGRIYYISKPTHLLNFCLKIQKQALILVLQHLLIFLILATSHLQKFIEKVV
uniref:Uncharacterized protein n=1 Tax=Cacopsylla melanoneura TaxID=428564 RepID=A0A8D8TEA5_9HEMI